jgi:hypothetical protein
VDSAARLAPIHAGGLHTDEGHLKRDKPSAKVPEFAGRRLECSLVLASSFTVRHPRGRSRCVAVHVRTCAPFDDTFRPPPIGRPTPCAVWEGLAAYKSLRFVLVDETSHRSSVNRSGKDPPFAITA